MPPYRIEYLCMREAPYWQTYGRGLLNLFQGKTYTDLDLAVYDCNCLTWRYHSARVTGADGTILHQV